MPDNNGIVVAGGDPTTEFLAVFGFKILTGSDKDVRCRIKLQKLSGPLLRQVVGHHKEGLLAQTQSLRFHRRGYHFCHHTHGGGCC